MFSKHYAMTQEYNGLPKLYKKLILCSLDKFSVLGLCLHPIFIFLKQLPQKKLHIIQTAMTIQNLKILHKIMLMLL